MLVVMLLVASAHAELFVFQDGLDSYNGTRSAWGYRKNPDDVQDSSTECTLQQYWAEKMAVGAVVGFDVSSIPGSQDTVTSATLTLTWVYGYRPTNYSGFEFELRDPEAQWDETAATWNSPGVAGQTWTSMKSTNNPVLDTDYPTWPGGAPWHDPDKEYTATFDVTDLVQGWIDDSSSNRGMAITADTTDDNLEGVLKFASEGYGTNSFRPKLEIETTPEPATLGLLAIGGLMNIIMVRQRRKRTR